MANFDDIIRDTEAAEGAANPEFRPLGGSSVEEEIYEDLGGPAVSIETEVSKFLKNNQVFELVIGIEKDKLLTFADHSLQLQKHIGYREMREIDLMDLLKGIEPTAFMNTKKTYFPSTNAALTAKEGVKSIISILIKEDTLSLGRKPESNIVDIARQSTSFEVKKVLEHLDTKNLFNEFIPVPMRRYEATNTVEIFVNTTVVLLAYLGLTLDEIKNRYQFSVTEDASNFYVLLKRI